MTQDSCTEVSECHYVALVSPHWASLDKILLRLIERNLIEGTNGSITVVIPEVSSVLMRSSRHKFFSMLKSFDQQKFVIFTVVWGWQTSRSYGLIRAMAVTDTILRRFRLRSVGRRRPGVPDLRKIISIPDLVIACPSAFCAHDRSHSQIEAANLLSGSSSLLTFHGALFEWQYATYLPSFSRGSKYFAQTKGEYLFLVNHGWPAESVVPPRVVSVPAPNLISTRSLLYLSRPTDCESPFELCRQTEREVLQWLARATRALDLALLVRLHPAENKIYFLCRWLRVVGWRPFRFDREVEFPACALAVTTHSSAILNVNVPDSGRFEILPYGTLNKNSFGPNIGGASREGKGRTVYSYQQALEYFADSLTDQKD